MKSGETRGRALLVAAALAWLGVALVAPGCETIDSARNCSASCGAHGMQSFTYAAVGSGCIQAIHPACVCNPPARAAADGGAQ